MHFSPRSLQKFFPITLMLAHWPGHTTEKPLWEFGLGLGGLHQPCYVGTRQYCNNFFPVILPVYRGEFLKSDDEGVRAEILEDERYKFDFSADFNFSVDSDEVKLRKGMPDVGNLLQVGPTFEYTTYEDEVNTLYFGFPARIVFEIDGTGIDFAGYTFSPGIVFKRQEPDSSLRFSLAASAQLRTQDFNALYYQVEPEFSNAERATYRASGGFSGVRLQAALSSNTTRNLWVFFVRFDNISGAVFEDSPLVETTDSFTIGLLYSRYLYKSKQTVIVTD